MSCEKETEVTVLILTRYAITERMDREQYRDVHLSAHNEIAGNLLGCPACRDRHTCCTSLHLCGYLRTGKWRGETGGGKGGNYFLHYRNRGFGFREGR